jgi:hypothetical protein
MQIKFQHLLQIERNPASFLFIYDLMNDSVVMSHTYSGKKFKYFLLLWEDFQLARKLCEEDLRRSLLQMFLDQIFFNRKLFFSDLVKNSLLKFT